jgi:23S rRNA maturation-related 3'-5' exoribonuclease YhaM
MTGFEAIAKISLLIADLIKRAKDKDTFGLIQQIQTYQLVVDKVLKEANLEIAGMKKALDEKDAKINELTLKLQNKQPPQMMTPFMIEKRPKEED